MTEMVDLELDGYEGGTLCIVTAEWEEGRYGSNFLEI